MQTTTVHVNSSKVDRHVIALRAAPMRRTGLVLAAALLATASVCDAAEVRGVRPCETWIEDRANGNAGAVLGETWVIGYLSGLAAATAQDILPGTDNRSIYAWLAQYCREHPGDDLADGAETLYWELLRQKSGDEVPHARAL